MKDRASRLELLFSQNPDSQKKILELYLENPSLISEDEPEALILEILAGDSFELKRLCRCIPEFRALEENKRNYSDEEVLKRIQSGDESSFGIKDLEIALKSSDERFRIPLYRYLESCTDPRHISYLVKRLPKRFSDEELLFSIRSFLTYSDDRIVANAIEGLVELKQPSNIPIFLQLLKHSSNRIRATAAMAIGKSDREFARKPLLEMLEADGDFANVKAALYVLKNLKDPYFLGRLVELSGNEKLRDEVIKTIAAIGVDNVTEFFENPVFNEKSWLKGQILAAINGIVRKRISEKDSEWSGKNFGQSGVCEVITGKSLIKTIKPTISFEDAQKKAENSKHKVLNFFSRVLLRPSEDDIKLIYSEVRYEPFWFIDFETLIDYIRENSTEIKVAESVVELKIGETIIPTEKRKVRINFEEHCIDKGSKKVCIDAVSGNNKNFDKLLEMPCRVVKSMSELKKSEEVIVPAKVKASIILRDLMRDLLKPLNATEIIGQKFIIKQFDLFFRPVYAFEFSYKDGEKKAIFEIDAVTGEMTTGKTIRAKFDDMLSESALFDIGADALGLVVPGGEIAAKIAMAVINSNQK